MVRTEMIQTSPSVALQQSTPPSSPSLPSSEHVITLSNAQEFIDMVKAIVAMQIASENPSPQAPTQPLTSQDLEQLLLKLIDAKSKPPKSSEGGAHPEAAEFAQQFLDVLKSLIAKQGPPPPPGKPFKAKGDVPSARASRLEFKTVHEVWDKEEYEYKTVESLAPPEETEYDEYIFVVRARIDKTDEKKTNYIDIKSEGLRDILRSVLKDVNGICLREEKPSVEQNLLYNYLPDLEAHRNNVDAALNDRTLQHLDLLLDFIKRAYASTTEHLSPLLEKHEITYDLLWALFKPNKVVYTTCAGTDKPRCVKFDFGEERKQPNGVEYFHMGCRYLDFDGKVFGEASTALGIEKFRGTRRINSLGVFPLQYHQSEKDTRAYLDKCSRKFLKLMDVHHCQYQGMAFYMKKNAPVKVFVDSRIMVDAAYFREVNPNYTRPSINEPDRAGPRGPPGPPGVSWVMFGPEDSRKRSSDCVKSNGMELSEVKGDDLLICSPTVLGFSLGNKLWAEFAVDDIKDIEWQPEAFDQLQMPEKKKKATQALSKAHMRRHETYPTQRGVLEL